MIADQVWPDHLLDLDEWNALPEDSSRHFELRWPTIRVPDVVLARPDVADDAPRLAADQVVLAVEILSPGTRRVDHVLKRHEYAQAGIGWYLLVKPGPPLVLTELRLVDGAYVQVAEHTGRTELALDVTLDLA